MSAIATKKVPLVCPSCEVYLMQAVGNMLARCPGCRFELAGEMLKTLVEILALPEALGTHACEECGHPQMRRLPDRVFHCPACHAEVTPLLEAGSPQNRGDVRQQIVERGAWVRRDQRHTTVFDQS